MSEEFSWPGGQQQIETSPMSSPPPSEPPKKEWGGNSGGGEKKQWKKKESTWIPRLPLYATVVANNDISEHECGNLVQIAQFLVSKGFKIRYAAHNKGLATSLVGTLPKESLESYIPWKGFDDVENADYFTNTRAKDLMAKINNSFKDLPNPTQNIIGVNCSLMYGGFCESPSSCLVVYTSDGCVNYKKKSKETGYASTVIELANRMNIPVYNTGNELTQDRFGSFINNFET